MYHSTLLMNRAGNVHTLIYFRKQTQMNHFTLVFSIINRLGSRREVSQLPRMIPLPAGLLVFLFSSTLADVYSPGMA